VAIKIIDKEKASQITRQAQLNRERRISQDKQHQNQHQRQPSYKSSKLDVAQPSSPPPSPIPEPIPSFMIPLQDEVQLLARLEHPNIIQIYQVIDTKDETFIIMFVFKISFFSFFGVDIKISLYQIFNSKFLINHPFSFFFFSFIFCFSWGLNWKYE